VNPLAPDVFDDLALAALFFIHVYLLIFHITPSLDVGHSATTTLNRLPATVAPAAPESAPTPKSGKMAGVAA
jgi:hypothetical protein